MQDPEAYLTQYGLELNDLQNIGIRRGTFVDVGTTAFTTANVLGKWAIFNANDHSDLNKHLCLCNIERATKPIVGYKYVSQTLDQDQSLNNWIDDLDLQWANPAGSISIEQKLQDGDAVVGTHVSYDTQSNPKFCLFAFFGTNCTYAKLLNNPFVGTKWINTVIQPATFLDYDVDAASSTHRIEIKGSSTVGLRKEKLNSLAFFPQSPQI